MLCRRTQPLPIEAVVRGYLSGSGWSAYRKASEAGGASIDLWGVTLPAGLLESERLPEVIFTPSTKATAGHDLPMLQSQIESYVGAYAGPVREAAITLYSQAAELARQRGILIADTKFEFGTLPGTSGDMADQTLILIDEALTPDSSRFWDAQTYAPGGAQPSFDKQFVRDYLESVPGWNKQPPPPDLPAEIVERTAEKYREAYRRITGRELN
jgi:phosphoribosylaminoimidazole-succinocarboxamide synthase